MHNCSPDYGNRFSDQYLGTPAEVELRAKTGRAPRRRSYAISLNRPVSEGSTCRYGFGPIWRKMHTEIFTAVTRVCLPEARLALNVSDFFENRQRVDVVRFWVQLASSLGWSIVDIMPVQTSRYRDGANSELRAENEVIIVANLNN